MNRVVQILIERDGNTQEEAEDRLNEVRDMIEDCAYNYEEVAGTVMAFLGLEMDYIEDII